MSKLRRRTPVKLKSSASPHCYMTTKNKQRTPEKLELRKYDPITRRHELYREQK